MPLKKPASVPKIPKARNKNAEAAWNAIPEKKPDKIEFICFASFFYDSVQKKQYYAITVETIAQFQSFSYEISVDVRREKNDLIITLMGLKTKNNYAPKIAPARTKVLFEDLFGEYKVHVVKQDGSINSARFNFNIYKKEILLLETYLMDKKNNRNFCEFKVNDSEFNFSG